jgi:signal transduction histidine kinase
VLAFPTVTMIATALLFAALGLLAAVAPTLAVDPMLVLAQFGSIVAVPVAFFLGLLRERLDEARVSDLVRTIQVTPTDQLGDALSTALGDPSLRIAFPAPGGYVDAGGGAVAVPDSAECVTVVGDAHDPVAVIVHDHSLRAEPTLLEAASAAVRLALENARLHEEVRVQLAQVRASRARLVTAGDDARRRLERDLHDGAQQRMLSVGLILSLLRQAMSERELSPQTVELLDEAETELRAATQELRELARGIHPAVLTLQGLRAAIEQLLVRVQLRTHVHISDLPELSKPIEATAYFVVSEALANTLRHAKATEVRIEVTAARERLTIRVCDDGLGGAAAAPGSGLTGLADRVAAVDGLLTLDSPQGKGTVLTVELPCG